MKKSQVDTVEQEVANEVINVVETTQSEPTLTSAELAELLKQAKLNERAEKKAKREAEKKAKKDKTDAIPFKFEQSHKLPTLCSVSVNRSVKAGKTVIEAAAGNWKISEVKSLTLKTCVAEQEGIIVEVFNIDKITFNAETPDGPNRYWFDLSPNEELTSTYKGQRVEKKKGMASPIIYTF